MTKKALKRALKRKSIEDLFHLVPMNIRGSNVGILWWKAEDPEYGNDIIYITVARENTDDSEKILTGCYTGNDFLAMALDLGYPRSGAYWLFDHIRGELPSIWDVPWIRKCEPRLMGRRRTIVKGGRKAA